MVRYRLPSDRWRMVILIGYSTVHGPAGVLYLHSALYSIRFNFQDNYIQRECGKRRDPLESDFGAVSAERRGLGAVKAAPGSQAPWWQGRRVTPGSSERYTLGMRAIRADCTMGIVRLRRWWPVRWHGSHGAHPRRCALQRLSSSRHGPRSLGSPAQDRGR